MISRAFKLRFRRRLRLQRRQVEEFGAQAERSLERNFFKRLERLNEVRRFVAGWLLLLVLLGGCVVAQVRALSNYYQVLSPAPGGTYTEGILGVFTNANPVYATGPVDAAVSKLLFASLMTYNEKNELVGDLAESLTANTARTVYTVKLKPNSKWHDGKPVTVADVVFTYQVIQNPDAQSPLNASWQGIGVVAIDQRTVEFRLPNSLVSFPYSLTHGILPKHVLEGASMAGLRTNDFNTSKAVGSGPFQLQAIEATGGSADNREERIALKAFADYHGGKSKLASFVVRSFRSQERLTESFRNQELTAVVGLSQVPRELQNNSNVYVNNLPLTAAVMTFFRTNEGVLSDVQVRQALVRGADTNAIIRSLGYPTHPVRSPFLQGQLGYNAAYSQAPFDLAAAQKILDTAGWRVGKNGIREKNGTPLTFKLFAQTNSEYATVAQMLQRQWRNLGVNVQVVLQSNTDFKSTLANHGYDALVYGISIGKDPDVFVYWHSAQADVRAPNRLNFSEYRSATADEALEAGRTRSDPALRVVKYQPFLQAWQRDAPALGLYQPRFLYLTRGPVYGLEERSMNTEIERFRNVHNWMIRQVRTTPTE